MPGSHTLQVALHAGNGTVEVDFSGRDTSASANNRDSADPAPVPAAQREPVPTELRLSAPPGDVERLLQRYGTSLPQYLDIERQRAAARSRLRWPILQGKPVGEPSA